MTSTNNYDKEFTRKCVYSTERTLRRMYLSPRLSKDLPVLLTYTQKLLGLSLFSYLLEMNFWWLLSSYIFYFLLKIKKEKNLIWCKRLTFDLGGPTFPTATATKWHQLDDSMPILSGVMAKTLPLWPFLVFDLYFGHHNLISRMHIDTCLM